MKRLLPFPLLAAALFVMWLLLAGVSPGQSLLGLVIALVVSRVMLLLAPERTRVRWGRALALLVVHVAADIVRSNIAVIRVVLAPPRERRSGFIRFPTALRNPYALAALATIITATPGTVWIVHNARRHTVLIHVLDLTDEAEWIALIRTRYEAPLMEIFA